MKPPPPVKPSRSFAHCKGADFLADHQGVGPPVGGGKEGEGEGKGSSPSSWLGLKPAPKIQRRIQSMAASIVSGCYERFILGHRCAEEAIVDGEASPSGGFSQTFAVKAHQGPGRCVAARGGLLASGGGRKVVI